MEELAWDTRVSPGEIAVRVDDGIVTLTGNVSCLAKKLAAEDAAQRVAGVLDVANDIAVAQKEDAYDDTELASAIRHALQWNVFVPDERIHSSVSHGVVTLRGSVETLAQRHEAACAVGALDGVVAIDNLIEVKRHVVAGPAVRAEIQHALQRRAQREVESITITVEDGAVTLTGPVHSWTEREAVLGAARGTRGVVQVIDQLFLVN
jgi:osmotically-inducible protein OsmY